MDRPIWKDEPDKHDYPAAASYLSLLAEADIVAALLRRLDHAPVAQFKAKDILRASGLVALPSTNPHVARDLGKIAAGTPLSPVLLIRGDLVHGVPAQVADGYHRICASYFLDEDADVPCRIAGPDGPHR
jgi:hypothetical protein